MTPPVPRVELPDTETLTCRDCGGPFERERRRGPKPLRCPTCLGTAEARRLERKRAYERERRTRAAAAVIDLRGNPLSECYGLAAQVTRYRSAINLALAALNTGHHADAVEALQAVQ